MVAVDALDVGHGEIRICKHTALAEGAARLRGRVQVLLVSGLQENETFRSESSTLSGFQVVPEWDEFLLA